MLTAGTQGTMYEIANEVFDDVVMGYQIYFDIYNAHQDELGDELHEIVGEMIESASDAMYEYAESCKEGFRSKLESYAEYEEWKETR